MKLKTKGVLTFLLISFGLTWVGISGARLLNLSMADPLVQLPLAFAPAIAAVIVRRWVTREGFRDAGLAPRGKTAGGYYFLAWIGPVLVLAASVATATLLGLYTPDFSPLLQFAAGTGLPAPVALLLWLAVPVLLMPVFWGEEFGWRSYLQPRAGRRPVPAALVTGVIWGVWHYPLVFTDYTGYSNPFLGIATWTLQTVLLSIILAWLFLRSGSVWVPCLAHAGTNMIIGTFSKMLLIDGGNLDPAVVDLLDSVPLVVICAWILLSGQLAAPDGPDEREPAENDPCGSTHAA
jgi:membrane protease YdiL (CAAX protease family)